MGRGIGMGWRIYSKLKGDTANAIHYFELTEKYGDAEAKEQARRSLMELGGKAHE